MGIGSQLEPVPSLTVLGRGLTLPWSVRTVDGPGPMLIEVQKYDVLEFRTGHGICPNDLECLR